LLNVKISQKEPYLITILAPNQAHKIWKIKYDDHEFKVVAREHVTGGWAQNIQDDESIVGKVKLCKD